MGDLVLRSLPMFLAPAPIGGLRRSRVALRRRVGGGSYVWGLCKKRSVGAGASGMELVYSTESSDGSVVFRFGTAIEVAEYLALKKAESEGVVEVEDGTLDENVVTGDEEETVESSTDEVADTNLCVEMQEDETDCTLGSSEKFSGVGVSSDYVGVSDCLDLIVDGPVEEPTACEDIDGRVPVEKVSSVGISTSNEIVVESWGEKIVSTFEKNADLDGNMELTLGKENARVESSNVLDDISGCSSEKGSVTVENASTSAGDFGAEEFESDDKEIPVVISTVTSNEEMARGNDEEFVGLQKSSFSVVVQPSASEISTQKDCFQTTDAASSLSSTVSANLSTSQGGFSYKHSNETNMIQETVATASSSLNQEDTDRNISVSTISVASQIENEIIVDDQEDTGGSISVATIPVASQIENEIIVDEGVNLDSEEGFLSTTGIDNLNLAAEKATPTFKVTKFSEAGILRDSATAISVSGATEQTLTQVADREEVSSVRLCLSIGAALLPKTLEALTGGEDAYFIAGETWFGVADGEGQWSLEGIDAGLYGHELMECCRRIVSDGGCCPTTTNEVLSRSAAEATLSGSATVLVAYFDGQVLHASNIGDTGFIIVRNGVILGRSMPAVHDFHFPHQIQKGYNPLEFVELYEIELNEGDIIVAATDGLFDNIYDQEIASIVTKSLQANLSPEEVAAVLAFKGQEVGRSTSTRSPFADAAQAAGYAGCSGGKLDDVAVIVSVAQKKS